VSGGHRQQWSVSGVRSGEWWSGNGAESGGSRYALSVFLGAHALTLTRLHSKHRNKTVEKSRINEANRCTAK